MSRPPHPNHHDDLPQPRGADAAEADALDALLNEIARAQGSPGTRSGPGQQRPDARSETEDASDATATRHAARAFHRRYEAAASRDPGMAALDPATWERVMATTTAQVKEEQGRVWRQATTPAATTARRPPASPVRTRRAARWGMVANATLALLLVLAAFGAWRLVERLDGGSDEPTATVPGVAMPPATPEAALAPAFACDFSASIPIFPDVVAAPVSDTALLLTNRGDLVLACPQEPEPVTLATGVEQVSPLGWPGIVSLMGEGVPGAQPITVLNILTGDSVRVGIPPEAMTFQWTQPEQSPWLVAPSFEEPGDWQVTDLRTMESRLYSHITGSRLLEGTILHAAASGDTLAVVPWAVGGDFDATAVIVEGSLDTARAIALPADLPHITEVRLAPDGRHLALKATDNLEVPTGIVTYSIVRAGDGAEIARSETFEDPMSTMRWVQEGAALAWTQENALMVLPVEPGGEPRAVFAPNEALAELRTTYDPAVVIVERLGQADYATETAQGIAQHVYLVNIVSGEAVTLDGRDASYNVVPWEEDSRFLVLYEPQVEEPELTDYQVVDAVSGELIAEIPDVPQPNGTVLATGWRAVVSTVDGSTEVIAFGAQHIYLMTVIDGAPVVRRIAPPAEIPAEVNGVVDLFLSPDGRQLSLTLYDDEARTRWLLPLDGEPDAWVAVPTPPEAIDPSMGPRYILFVPGTGEWSLGAVGPSP